MLTSNEEFLKQLAELFDSRKGSQGSVFITMKRMTYKPPGEDDVTMNPAEDTGEGITSSTPGSSDAQKRWPCLIRATDGKGKEAKRKISTIVAPEDHATWSSAYNALLKASFSTLRPKQKKKTKKAKTTSTGGASGGTTSKTKQGAIGKGKKGASPRQTRRTLTKITGPRRGAGAHKRRKLMERRKREVKRAWASRRKA
ncbi:BQ2448_6614 [Microbotryum intermedium]|uniref:Signal recognition particle subunit SRP14 n=1 Tax=Microbotryum intermedium TaxID=269621 RepID=A0A238FK72_9BASI|nr:BQ2448_6614 [Microbotryum intermedium]